MENSDFNIFIVGQYKAKRVYNNLKKTRKNTYFLKKEKDYIQAGDNNQFRIFIIEESENSMQFLEEIASYPRSHIIYLSNNKSYINVVHAISKGVTDYIYKDSYLFYSILKSIQKSEKFNKESVSNRQIYFDTCAIRRSYPLKFIFAKWLSLFYR